MTIATIIIITVCIYGLLAWANSRVGMGAPNMKPGYFAEKPAIFDDKTALMWDGKAFSIKPAHIDYLEGCEWPEAMHQVNGDMLRYGRGAIIVGKDVDE